MSTTPTPVAILVRVSTNQQDTDRQLTELRQVATQQGWQVVAELREVISGNAQEVDRSGLAEAMALAEGGIVRKILVHEVSRLARRNSVAHSFLERLEAAGASLYWHAQRIESLLPSGKRNPAAAIMFALLAEMARAERETLVERTLSGLAEARRKGVRLGRPVGTGLDRAALLARHRDVVRLLREGQSVRHTAAITGKSAATVQKVASELRKTA